MSDKENGNGNGKKKKGINWSGMAAFITAIAGIIGMFLIQDKNGNDQDMVAESTFAVSNARIERLEERIIHLERMLMSAAMGATAMMVETSQPECHTDDDCDEGSICEEAMCVPEFMPVEAHPEPAPPPMPDKRDKAIEKFSDYKEIKEHVQTEQMPVRF